jgi:hypothetical protein
MEYGKSDGLLATFEVDAKKRVQVRGEGGAGWLTGFESGTGPLDHMVGQMWLDTWTHVH